VKGTIVSERKWPDDLPRRPFSFFGRPRMSRPERIRRQIEKDRESRVPTWALVLALIGVLALWAALILIP
jgi:hypothetical protein